jgi:hypothetical protein
MKPFFFGQIRNLRRGKVHAHTRTLVDPKYARRRCCIVNLPVQIAPQLPTIAHDLRHLNRLDILGILHLQNSLSWIPASGHRPHTNVIRDMRDFCFTITHDGGIPAVTLEADIGNPGGHSAFHSQLDIGPRCDLSCHYFTRFQAR